MLSLITRLIAFGVLASSASAEQILFKSAALGATGITAEQITSQEVIGTNVNSLLFVGARFELASPVVLDRVGGHFGMVGNRGGDFFGAIIKLTDSEDVPDSSDLSSPDVVGSTTLTFPDPSAEVFGELELALQPGWYGVVFGSGLFGTDGVGAAVRNGVIGSEVSFLRWSPGAGGDGWSSPLNRFDKSTFTIVGRIVPEPSALMTMLFATTVLMRRTMSR